MRVAYALHDVGWVSSAASLTPVKAGAAVVAHSPLFNAHGIRHAFGGRGSSGVEVQYVKQIHGTNIVAASAATTARAESRPLADGIFTTQRALGVAVRTADCVPILCCDRQARLLALALHAGRRGLLGGIVARAVDCLETQGVKRRDALWSIGPAIGAAAYEVGPAEMEAVHGVETGLNATQVALCLGKGRDDRWHLDLQLVAVLQLLNCGVSAAQIDVIRICTYMAATMFHSYRFDKNHLGSNWSYVALA